MPFRLEKAAAHVQRVTVSFNKETLVVYYNAGSKFAEYQKATQRKEAEMRELIARAENPDAATGKEREELVAQLQREVQRTRLDVCKGICSVIDRWDLEAGKDFDRTAIRENFLAGLTEEERAELSEEDLAALQYELDDEGNEVPIEGPGLVPVSGIWLHALPLPDEFVLKIIEDIGTDFNAGGAAGKAR